MDAVLPRKIFRSFCHALAAVFCDPRQFKRQWRQYRPSSDARDTLEGRWDGQWISEVNGHHGDLRCLLTRSGLREYNASFYATYAKWLRVCYGVTLNAQMLEDQFHLQGEIDLGTLAGGIYRYDGRATPEGMRCAYRNAYDSGEFCLRRLD